MFVARRSEVVKGHADAWRPLVQRNSFRKGSIDGDFSSLHREPTWPKGRVWTQRLNAQVLQTNEPCTTLYNPVQTPSIVPGSPLPQKNFL
jgi:hypothetical protein